MSRWSVTTSPCSASWRRRCSTWSTTASQAPARSSRTRVAPAQPIQVRHPAADPLVIVGSRSHRGDSLDSVLERIGAHEMRPMGSSLKFCLVAEGTADFYPRLGPTCEWDTAAAQAVVEAAGGSVTTLDGLPLRYNERDTLLNPHFLAYGDASRHWHKLF